MKSRLLLSALALSAITIVGCGGSGGKKGSSKKPNQNEKVNQNDPGYNYDFNSMAALNEEYTDSTGSDPLWTVRVAVNGEEKVNLLLVSLKDVKTSLSSLSFKHYDVVRTEITIQSSDDKVLGTNVKEVADQSNDLKQIWEAECSYFAEPEHEISETDFQYMDGENRLQLTVSVCDFAGFTLKPVMQIKPQKKNLEKKLVVYHCEFVPDYASTSSTSPYIQKYVGDTPCGYGYETLDGETAPKIEILKEYAPGTSLYNAKLLRFDSVKLSVGNAGQFLLDTDFYNPPFGSLTACHTMKLDVKYATGSGVAVKRLEFKRSDQAGGVTWMPQNESDWPAVKDIARYYKESESEKMHLYRFCDWIPEAKDLKAGNVISINN